MRLTMRGHLAAATLAGVALGLAIPHLYGAGVGLPSAHAESHGVTQHTTNSVEPQGRPPMDSDGPEVITEDDPLGRWNCLTMGNHRCGTDWVPVTQQLGDALSEGSDRPWTYPWESCLVRFADTTIVVCPDGTVVTS